MAAADVDEYLADVPDGDRKALERIRRTIRSAAPEADEVISYGIPLYKLNGHLIGFAAFKKHLSLFVTNSAVLKRFAAELEPFECKGTTIHFSAERPIPEELVTAIVEVRIAENAAR